MSGADPVSAVRALLPWWVGWANLLYPSLLGFLASILGTWVTGRVALLLAGRGSEGESWAARAARLFPVRRAMAVSIVFDAVVFTMIALHAQGPLSLAPAVVAVWAAALPAVLGGSLVPRLLAPALGDPPRRFGSWWKNLAIACLAFFPHVLILVAMASMMPREAGIGAVVGFVAAVVGLVAVSRGTGLALLRGLGISTDAPERIRRLVREAAGRLALPPPRVSVLDTGLPNAFAFPASNELVFTRRAVELLDDDELGALTLHELGHLCEPGRAGLARSATIWVVLPLGATPLWLGLFGIWGVLVVFGAVILALAFVRRFRQRMERHADSVAHTHAEDPASYARALERLHEAAGLPAVTAGKGQIHGHLYDRMVAAGVTPEWERPKPPRRIPGLAGALAGALTLVAVTGVVLIAFAARAGWVGDEAAVVRSIALGGGSAWEVAALGAFRLGEDRGEEAVVFYQAAARLDRRSVDAAASLALALVHLGRCAEADAALRDAEARAARLDATVWAEYLQSLDRLVRRDCGGIEGA